MPQDGCDLGAKQLKLSLNPDEYELLEEYNRQAELSHSLLDEDDEYTLTFAVTEITGWRNIEAVEEHLDIRGLMSQVVAMPSLKCLDYENTKRDFYSNFVVEIVFS